MILFLSLGCTRLEIKVRKIIRAQSSFAKWASTVRLPPLVYTLFAILRESVRLLAIGSTTYFVPTCCQDPYLELFLANDT